MRWGGVEVRRFTVRIVVGSVQGSHCYRGYGASFLSKAGKTGYAEERWLHGKI